MQERLEKWRQKLNPEQLPKKNQRDYGDDIRDYERKERDYWQREQMMNPSRWK